MPVRDITVAVTGMAQGFAVDTRTRIQPVILDTDALVEDVHVRLTALTRPVRTVVAQVGAEVNGRRIRVQRTAGEVGLAVEHAADALRQRISEANSPWRPRPWPHPAGGYGPGAPKILPHGAARITRVKTLALVWCSPDAAARTMDAMDYDVHLFVDPETETEAAVYRIGPTGYRLARTVAAGPPVADRGVPWTLNPGAANRLTDQQALDRLERAEMPHTFYADPATGSGRVLYRRFDGHFGLITPARRDL